MATNEEVNLVLDILFKNRPQKVFDKMEKFDHGIFAVVKYLYTTNGEVKSKDISDFLVISSARMAKLLQKLENKLLVEKYSSSSDARITLVKLTNEGRELAIKMEEYGKLLAQHIIDDFGIERLNNMFFELSEFKQIMMTVKKIDFLEENDD